MRAPIRRKMIPVAIKLKMSSSVAFLSVPSEEISSRAPSFRSFFRTKKAVPNAKMYIRPYQRISPKTGTPGKISG